MPAQSGSDAVLARMGRGYTRAVYEDKLAMLREKMPDATFASDFIVGFPGESDHDFDATEELVRTAGFQNCFLFKYSPRPGTRAAETMPDDVPDAVKRERHRRLLSAQAASAKKQAEALVGSLQEVMVEGFSPRDGGRLIGRTGGNRIAVFAAPPDAERWPGRLARVRVDSATALTLYASLADS
jgi:tRNA-2-methylthio-N6-dimethylallyladenosine synthase